jgi:hypothetical protein
MIVIGDQPAMRIEISDRINAKNHRLLPMVSYGDLEGT